MTAGLFLVMGSEVLWDGSWEWSDAKALRCLLGRGLPGGDCLLLLLERRGVWPVFSLNSLLRSGVD